MAVCVEELLTFHNYAILPMKCPVGKVILKPEYQEKKTTGGIILNVELDQAREKQGLNHARVWLSNHPDIPVGCVAHYRDGTYWKNEVRVNQDEFTVDESVYLSVDEKDGILLIYRSYSSWATRSATDEYPAGWY